MKRIFILILLCLFGNLYSQNYTFENVVTGLTEPSAVAFLPDNNVIINNKRGPVGIYSLNNTMISAFWNFSDSINLSGEKGVLGVCLDPNYSTNKFVYIFYNPNTSSSSKIVRLTNSSNIGTNPFIVWSDTGIIGAQHVGGFIGFGKDNKLYITVGDNFISSNAQSLTTHKGKILRINSDGSIPTDNPFYDDGNPHTGNDDRIWAYGIRNSYGFCFSPVNDSMYESENMASAPDEVNFIRKGKNYGWPVCAGNCFPYNPLYKNPITELPGNGFQNYAPTGIIIYNGSQMPELNGKLLVISSGGVSFKGLVKCDLGNPPFLDTIVSKTVIHPVEGYSALKQGNDGFIYMLKFYQGPALQRLIYDVTAVNNQNTPVNFSLSQNFPNPFNPVTSIKYEIPKSNFVSLKIYDILGIEVASLINETKLLGSHEVSWDAAGYPSGIYFYEMHAGDYKERKKMVLIK